MIARITKSSDNNYNNNCYHNAGSGSISARSNVIVVVAVFVVVLVVAVEVVVVAVVVVVVVAVVVVVVVLVVVVVVVAVVVVVGVVVMVGIINNRRDGFPVAFDRERRRFAHKFAIIGFGPSCETCKAM